ncbi:MAG TPA: ABC transporter permease [Bryobacteraceae bacterium]|jgi:predicted permease|nr:ABC transporter permease [Bryobacteraceae bacterium]
MALSRFFRRRHWDAERARELRGYIEIETDENIARGMTPEEARSAAHRKLGNEVLVREEIYRMNSIGFLETFWQDLRYGARSLRLNLGFTAIAIASLTLGIGANTTIFQLLDAIRLRSLPVKNPQELAMVHIANRNWGAGTFHGSYPQLTNPLWEQLRDQQQAFSSIATWTDMGFNLAKTGEARSASGLLVSGAFFDVLGVTPVRGRVFTSAEDQRGCAAPGAVISYAFWQREFGRDPSVLGRSLTLEGHPFPVIGITPASFFGVDVGGTFDVAIPLCAEPLVRGGPSFLDLRHVWFLAAIGRLKPGWSLVQATAHLNTISPGLFDATIPTGYGSDMKDYLTLKLGAFPASKGFNSMQGGAVDPLWILMASTGLVLLIACANLANLMLARASAREREISVRLAIGASRGRLVRQLLSESLLLAVAGTVLGALLAPALNKVLLALLTTESDEMFLDFTPDWRVFAFLGCVAVSTCILFGLAPALRATRAEPGTAMKASGRANTATREGFGLRRLLVVSQVALSLVLLVGALLFLRSFRNLLAVDPGFRQDGILLAGLDPRRLGVPKEQRFPLRQEIIRRLQAIPGVEAAADASVIPLGGSSWTQGVRMDAAQTGQAGSSRFDWVGPEFFKTMEIPLLAGRVFDEHDSTNSPSVAIVNESFAGTLLNGVNPIGRTFHTVAEPDYPETVYQIVGVVKDTKYQTLRESQQKICFVPSSQYPLGGGPFAQILIRSNVPLPALTEQVKSAIAGVSPDILISFQVFKTMIRDHLVEDRAMALLSGFFAALATLLAVIGLYGVMSYMVARRRTEIGIRMALGADSGDVSKMILREAGLLLAIGLAIGTGLAMAVSTAASTLLFGLTPHDPTTLAVAAAALALAAVGASYLPARRAARLDPMLALREE